MELLHGFHAGELEVRASKGGVRLRGRFPYNKTATLSDGGRTGRPRKERIAPRAFSYRVEKPDEDIHLLFGHDYNTPLASKLTDTLLLRETDEALWFDAQLIAAIAETSYGRDVIAMIEAGLGIGISPGFRLPPKRAVAVAEEITEEAVDPDNGMHGAIIRTVREALLYELSVVTVPAYKEAQIAMRNWSPTADESPDAGLRRTLSRWRA